MQLLSQYWVPHLQEAVSCAPKGLVLHPLAAAAQVVSAEKDTRILVLFPLFIPERGQNAAEEEAINPLSQ